MDLLKTLAGWLLEAGVSGFIDVMFMSLLIYTFLVWSKRTRVAFVIKGIFVVLAVYLLARQFDLVMMAGVLEKFFAVFFVIIVIIFQEELKCFFEWVASLSFTTKLFGPQRKFLPQEGVEALSRVLVDLARERIGALVVIQGKDIIARHLEGGVDLNGELSGPLLESIFDPHSTGHDGAVVVTGGKLLKFSCHLPLSKNFHKLKKHGTRHAAALGLSELSDALCLVVSEEYGTISVARKGDIEQLEDPSRLLGILEQFYQEIHPRNQESFWTGFLRQNSREKVYAVLLAALLWVVLVHGSKLTYKSLLVPVTYAALPEPWTVEKIEPAEIEVVLKGTRGNFYFLRRDRVKVFLNLKPVKNGGEIPVHSHNILLPSNIVLESFAPHSVAVSLKHPD